MDTFQKDVSSILYQFAEKGIIPSEEYYKEGNRLANKVFQTLQTKSRFSIARVLISGSVGKRTGIFEPDMDLVIAVNNFKPSFESYKKVLDEFEQILVLNEDELEIQEGTIDQPTDYSVQFNFKNGIEVDLLPAANLETRQVCDLIAKNPSEYYVYNLSLAPKQVAFVKSHPSSFVHCLIRLLKFWFKSLVGLGKVSGKGYILEVVGVAAADEEERGGAPCILRAFNRAIGWICNLNYFKLAFQETYENKWVRVPPTQLVLARSQSLVPNVVGIRDILKRDYFIIDPANPYNDMLEKLAPAKMKKLMEFATVTKQRLQDLMNKNQRYINYNAQTNVIHVDILQLFQSQPFFQQQDDYPMAIPSDSLISYADPYSSLCSDMKVRNERIFKDWGVKNCVYAMKWNLFCAVNSAIHGNVKNQQCQQNVGSTSTAVAYQKDAVAKVVANLVETAFKTTLGPGSLDRHEKMDVTLSVPYRVNDTGYSVKVSMSWK